MAVLNRIFQYPVILEYTVNHIMDRLWSLMYLDVGKSGYVFRWVVYGVLGVMWV